MLFLVYWYYGSPDPATPMFVTLSKCMAQLISFTSLFDVTNVPVFLSIDKPSYPVLNPIY